MEYYFEEISANSVKALTEMRYRIGGRNTYIAVAIYLLLDLFFIWAHSIGVTSWFVVVFSVVMTLYIAATPYIMTCRGLKQLKKFYNGEIPAVRIQFGDQIFMQTHDSAEVREYHQIAKVRSLKYTYCLVLSNKTVIMLDRDAFTKGTFEEFKQFLRAKRPDLKIPD